MKDNFSVKIRIAETEVSFGENRLSIREFCNNLLEQSVFSGEFVCASKKGCLDKDKTKDFLSKRFTNKFIENFFYFYLLVCDLNRFSATTVETIFTMNEGEFVDFTNNYVAKSFNSGCVCAKK